MGIHRWLLTQKNWISPRALGTHNYPLHEPWKILIHYNDPSEVMSMAQIPGFFWTSRLALLWTCIPMMQSSVCTPNCSLNTSQWFIFMFISIYIYIIYKLYTYPQRLEEIPAFLAGSFPDLPLQSENPVVPSLSCAFLLSWSGKHPRPGKWRIISNKMEDFWG